GAWGEAPARRLLTREEAVPELLEERVLRHLLRVLLRLPTGQVLEELPARRRTALRREVVAHPHRHATRARARDLRHRVDKLRLHVRVAKDADHIRSLDADELLVTD